MAELKHHFGTIIDCKLNKNGTLYSTLDIQNHVKSMMMKFILFIFFTLYFSVWSANEDFDIITSLISRTSTLQCQAFDNRESLLYLGTSVSTVKVLHITEKRIINEAIIDKYYPRIMYLYPHTIQSKFFERKKKLNRYFLLLIMSNLDRLFVSLASESRLSTTENGRTRSGRVSILDTQTWSVERVLSDHDENFATCMTLHPNRQLLILGKIIQLENKIFFLIRIFQGFNDGKISFYDIRSNTIVHQKQQHSRLVQDIHFVDDYLYSIGNDNMIIQSSLSSFDQFIQSHELPYSAVGPYQISSSASTNGGSPALVQRTSTSLNTTMNQFFPIGNVFAIDPYDSDRLLTCSSLNARFYRLSIGAEDSKLSFPSLTSSEMNSPSSCVHWNKEKDICLTANTNGVIQLYRRVNKPDM